MPSITDELPLPPLWKQRACFDKLTSGPLVQWLEVPELGPFCVLQADDSLLCVCLEKDTSSVEGKVEIPPEDPTICFTAAVFDGEVRVVTAHRSSLMRLWSGTSLGFVASFKAQHMGPVILLKLSCTSGLLYSASSSGDSSIKVWSLGDQQCLQTFRPVTSRPTTLGVFSKASDEHMCIGTVEGCVSVWKRGDEKPVHLRKHVSPIACLEFSERFLLSGGRDQIIAVWDVDSWVCVKVIPVFENINTMRMLPPASKSFLCPKVLDEEVLVTGGQNGVLKIWNVSSKSELRAPGGMESWTLPNVPVIGIHFSKEKLFFCQDDVIFSKSISVSTEDPPAAISLNENEVTDLVIVGDRFLVVSTSSHLLRSYDTRNSNAMTVSYSPDEVTMTLAACRKGSSLFASAGRSKVVRIWRVTETNELQSLAALSGHSASVMSIILIDRHIISADQDGVLKMWLLTETFDSGTATCTKVCHEKEVTCLDLHLARGLIVSASLDKEAKLWNIADVSQVASLRGHRRGIVCATFSTHDNVLATGSSDLVFKLWHTNTFACLQTIEGLSGVPTKTMFMTKSALVNVTANGHLTFWELSSKEQKIPLVFEAHSEQVWGLCLLGEELITGGKDGKIIFWRDNRQEVETEKAARKASAVKFEQMLANSIRKGNVVKAVNLSLKLEKPHHAYKYLVQAHDEGSLATVLEGISPKLLPRLVGYSRQWNTISRQLVVAQHVQNFVLSRNLLTDESLSNLQGMLMFNNKHFSRLTALTNKLALVDNMLMYS